MGINFVPDVGSPLTVVAVDLVAESFIPAQAEFADYVMTLGGYVAAFMGWGGDYIKNIGIASAPLTARKIYERVRGAAAVTKVATKTRQRVTRSYEPEFDSVGVI